jgi:hypothetical protein
MPENDMPIVVYERVAQRNMISWKYARYSTTLRPGKAGGKTFDTV